MKNDVQNIYKIRLDIDKILFYFILFKNKFGNYNEGIFFGFVLLFLFFIILFLINLYFMSI